MQFLEPKQKRKQKQKKKQTKKGREEDEETELPFCCILFSSFFFCEGKGKNKKEYDKTMITTSKYSLKHYYWW